MIKNMEAIDYYTDKGIIDHRQQEAALHFRNLYYKRYGSYMITAKDPTHIGGKNIFGAHDNNKTIEEEIYRTSITYLQKLKLASVIINTCIYNKLCKNYQIASLRYGLDFLYKLYAINNKKYYTKY
jgi:hypothetical protein